MGPIIQKISEAYNIIKNPNNWCQQYYQKDKDGNNCPWREGVSFCAIGAVNFVCWMMNRSSDESVSLLQIISEEIYGKSIQSVNDELGHSPVLNVYETALERFAEKDPSPEALRRSKYTMNGENL